MLRPAKGEVEFAGITVTFSKVLALKPGIAASNSDRSGAGNVILKESRSINSLICSLRSRVRLP
jgi:hypothetical protein